MEGLGGELVLGLNQAPSMNAVLRALKKEEASMFCCVASIAHDAQFVQQVRLGAANSFSPAGCCLHPRCHSAVRTATATCLPCLSC